MLFFEEQKHWSEDHDFCVRKVEKFLRNRCSEVRTEKSISPHHRADVYGYSVIGLRHYICEVKVSWADCQKGVFQLKT
jgi:hypothetical protein